MKKNSLSQIAINTALLTASISVIVFAVALPFLAKQYLYLSLPIIFIIILAVAYFFFSKALEKHVQQKIHIIYKTIRNLKVAKGEANLHARKISDNILDDVNQEVIDWAKSKKTEIDKLKDSEKYRREFLANVSHELKTPIFNIEGYLHTLIDGGIDNPKINKEYLIKAGRNVDRLSSIIEELETISQLESGEVSLLYETFDIRELALEVCDEQEMMADANDIKFKVEQGTKPILVKADKKQIRQVMSNLVSNSIKYGKENDSGITKIKFFDMDDHMLIEVTDNGIGIAEESLPRLFERFYRVDSSRSRLKGGTGLGLAIVKHILEAHNETINVRSTLGVGTTFGFTLKKG